MIEFFIPLLPDRALSPNGAHGHWSKVSAARKELRDAAGWLARNASVLYTWGVSEEAFDPARVTLTCRQTRRKPRDGRYRPRDIPNATYALKPVWDGLQDAGLIVDDSAEHMPESVVRIEWIEEYRDEGVHVKVEAI